MTRVELPPDPGSAAAARALVRRTLAPECPPDLVDVVALLVSELVANAVVHARTPVRVAMTSGPVAVRVEVSDQSPEAPRVRDVAPDDVSGRGLQMVEALADAWGVEPDGAGKTIWFEVSPQQ